MKAIKGYLEDFKTKVDTTIDNTAQALQDLTGEEKAKTYFGDYCKAKYKEGQDYVSDQVDKLPDDGGDDDSAGGECLADGGKHIQSYSPLNYFLHHPEPLLTFNLRSGLHRKSQRLLQ